MRHHTKDKGDIGVGMVLADLMSRGIQVALTVSEHMPFDLVAISPTMELARVQVKYRRLGTNGTISVKLKSSWADRSGSHDKVIDFSEVDGFAVYCLDVGKVFYVPVATCSARTAAIHLRVSKSANNQEARVRRAADHLDPNVLFADWRARRDSNPRPAV